MTNNSDNTATMDMVREFHKKAGLSYDRPPSLDCDWMGRYHLMAEELEEFKQACEDGDLTGAFDALLDLQYVLDGSFLETGLDRLKKAGFQKVHQSNLSKIVHGSNKGHHQKIAKGPDYFPPELDKIIDQALTESV